MVSIKVEKARERGKMPYTAPRPGQAGGQVDLSCVVVLVEATREREQAALRISALSRRAVDRLLQLADEPAYS